VTAPVCMRAALEHARRGRLVLPVEGKRPLTPHGLNDATSEAPVIVGWWRRWPAANVALRTGQCSGLVVLDVDGPEGADSLHELEKAHGALPKTTSATTPRGGQHFFFRAETPVKTTAGVVAPGVDVRGEGGFAVIAPSIGRNGRRYEWDDRAPLAPLPGWLLERVVDRPADRRPAAPVETWLSMVRRGLEAGQRNSGPTRLAGHLLAKDVDARLVLDLAHLVNDRGKPPLPARDVDRIVESIATRELRKRKGGGR
jgi:hypothetical protein